MDPEQWPRRRRGMEGLFHGQRRAGGSVCLRMPFANHLGRQRHRCVDSGGDTTLTR